ncbi:MAG: hypothetical protein A2787_00595 [Omnitrophica WOR_2 bacterium RIFCSPHIGHO2_01_FULL_48_9]|nr:MAG: hypothetical protein A3D10_02710 [Omnitrophica WOR_2 bacterium RIFCSPHIGHO2_02_FULL_48_11]OGX33630.1 MAG: hypothetical protein A2787_00595 [Omnitrophica WOR_2 bacterium RIFCSPHIGHO2_01_FULL_48_9]
MDRYCFRGLVLVTGGLLINLLVAGCTVKAVGDPKRPITIEAHITVDIKGLKDTATDIEDFVSGQKPNVEAPSK